MTPERIKTLVAQAATEVVADETQLRDCERDVQLLLEHNRHLCAAICVLEGLLEERERTWSDHRATWQGALVVAFGLGTLVGVVACRLLVK